MFGFIYSIASYLGFLGAFTYFAFFSDGVLVPKTVDSGVAPGQVSAVFVDLALILLFGLQHSIMARAGFKRVLTRFIPARVERATFVFASTVVLVLLMWQWRPLPAVLWSIDGAAAAVPFWIINALGWLGVPACSFLIDHFDLFGVKQTLVGFRRVTFERKGFVTPLFYRYVRHPMMTSILLGLWVTPHMTVGHLLLSIGMGAYVLLGVHFEERALAAELGLPYRRYQASTPKFLPLGMRQAKAEGPSSSPTTREAT